jgi:uncharacterized membrane protein
VSIAFLVLLLVGGIVAAVGVLGLLGRLPPNSWAGIRLPYTMACDKRWYDTHRGAAPVFIFGGVAVAVVNLSFLPFAIAGRIPDGLALVVVLASAFAILLVVLQAALVGVRFAQARESHEG